MTLTTVTLTSNAKINSFTEGNFVTSAKRSCTYGTVEVRIDSKARKLLGR